MGGFVGAAGLDVVVGRGLGFVDAAVFEAVCSTLFDGGAAAGFQSIGAGDLTVVVFELLLGLPLAGFEAVGSVGAETTSFGASGAFLTGGGGGGGMGTMVTLRGPSLLGFCSLEVANTRIGPSPLDASDRFERRTGPDGGTPGATVSLTGPVRGTTVTG
jgi:hypothetical protein